MSRHLKLPVLGAVAFTLGACNSEPTSVQTPVIPTAGVRFIHAVPDTGALDFRFVDIPENSALSAVPFRNNIVTSVSIPASTMVQYKNARAGSARHFRIFLNSTDQAIASTVLKDTTVNLEANKNYTILLFGYANPTGPNRPAGAPPMRLRVIEESVADPSPNIAMRVVNTTTTALDVRHYKYTAAVPTTPPPAAWTNIPGMTLSAYVTAAPDTFRLNVRNAGTTTRVFADLIALRGAPAVTTAPGPFDAVPGTGVAGSAVSAIIFPRSVAGTAAPQTAAFTVPAISFVWDRRPPRPPGV